MPEVPIFINSANSVWIVKPFFLLEFVSSELYENQYQLNQLKLHETAQTDMDKLKLIWIVTEAALFTLSQKKLL